MVWVHDVGITRGIELTLKGETISSVVSARSCAESLVAIYIKPNPFDPRFHDFEVIVDNVSTLRRELIKAHGLAARVDTVLAEKLAPAVKLASDFGRAIDTAKALLNRTIPAHFNLPYGILSEADRQSACYQTIAHGRDVGRQLCRVLKEVIADIRARKHNGPKTCL